MLGGAANWDASSPKGPESSGRGAVLFAGWTNEGAEANAPLAQSNGSRAHMSTQGLILSQLRWLVEASLPVGKQRKWPR